jgi:hypothetical protein
MRKILLPLFAFALSIASNAQTFQWAKTFGTASAEKAYSIDTDKTGNIYVTGVLLGTMDFDPSANTFNLTSAGQSDIFLASYTTTGDFRWAFKVGNTVGDEGLAVVVDASDNVIITGDMYGPADFDPSTNTFTVTPQAYNDPFLAKYDSQGNLKWAFAIRCMGYDYGYALAVGPENKLYISGRYSKTADFDPSANTVNVTSVNNSIDAFVACYDSMGVYQWVNSIGDMSVDMALGVKVDKNSNVYVSGYFADSIKVNPSGSEKLYALGQNDAFVAKYDAVGNYIWANRIGADKEDNNIGLAIDGNCNVYVYGKFQDTIDFNPGIGVDTLIAVAGSSDSYIVKYNANGVFKWVKRIGNENFDDISSVTCNQYGELYVTGSFLGTIDFDQSVGVQSLIASANDAYLCKYDSTGVFKWVKSFGIANNQYGSAVAVDKNNSFYYIGYYYGGVTLDGILQSNAGQSDWFMVKYADPVLPVGLCASKVVLAKVYPNPCDASLNLSFENEVEAAKVRILNLNGVKVFEKENLSAENILNIRGLADGTYLLELQNGAQISRQLIIKK